MKISNNLPKFNQKTMIAVVNGRYSKFYLAEDRKIDLVKEIQSDDMGPYDMQKGLESGRVEGVVETFVNDKIHDKIEDQFIKFTCEQLYLEFQQGNFEKLIVFVPESKKNQFNDNLHTYLKEALIGYIPKILHKEHETSLLSLIDKEFSVENTLSHEKVI
ncbi:hypothetical protein GF376_01895 [Candidatus Peregrinibacteria bacterium]|nr:hypothetical protein [Candidatus Peregrinibacteria bacterium]